MRQMQCKSKLNFISSRNDLEVRFNPVNWPKNEYDNNMWRYGLESIETRLIVIH